jgi:nucleoside-diphosphate-sugar epimerase
VNLVGGEFVFVDPRPGDPRRTEADTTLAKQLLDWQPTIALPDGIEELKKEWGI